MRCHWNECPSSVTHGNIIQRSILTRQDPKNPGKRGAVLRHVDSFAHGYLEGRVPSVAETHAREQEVFYVAAGEGEFEGGGLKRNIGEGDGILVPASIPHVIRNRADVPLELLMVRESLPDGVSPRAKAPLIRNYRERPLTVGHLTHLVHHIFTDEDGLFSINLVLTVRIEAFQTPDRHRHPDGHDEVWYMLRGTGVHLLGSDVYIQSEGVTVACYPESAEHSLINHTDQPLVAFLFAHLVRR
ncbi:MAG: cupin domain-containing protein [Chloroflexi bacterium]|nr:cupin domain-containing protein [Chloroflexota bacterium]